MSVLEAFASHNGRVTCKYTNYFKVYDEIFQSVLYPPEEVKHVLELGVLKGGSLEIWAKTFPNAQISGIDLKKSINYPRVNCYLGSQWDNSLFEQAATKSGKINLMIDDASHIAGLSLKSLEVYMQYRSAKSAYVCEDTCTHLDENREGFSEDETLLYLQLIGNLCTLAKANNTLSACFSMSIFGASFFDSCFPSVGSLGITDLAPCWNQLVNDSDLIDARNALEHLDNPYEQQLVELKTLPNRPGVYILLYLLANIHHLRQFKPSFIPSLLLEDLDKLARHLDFFVVRDGKAFGSLRSSYVSQDGSAINYGSKWRLVLFEAEARIKNRLIRVGKAINIGRSI